MNVPVIRIEVERMRYAICAALAEREASLDLHINEAITRYIDGGQMLRDLDRHVQLAISGEIQRQTEEFFRYGPGRKVIAQTIIDRLAAELERKGDEG